MKRMKTIRQQVEIAWPQKALFHYLADADTHPKWRRYVVESLWEPSRKNVAGGKLVDQQRLLGKDSLVVWSLLEVEPYRKWVMYRRSLSFSTLYTIELNQAGESTVLTLSVATKSNLPKSARLHRALQKSSEHMLTCLKQSMETD